MRFPLLFAAGVLGLLVACHGPADGGGRTWRLFGPTESPRALVTPVQPLRRLTRREYDNTLRDLLGDTSSPASAFPSEASGTGGFASPGAVSEVEARRFLEAAEAVAAKAVGDLPRLTGCDPTATKGGEPACAHRFVEGFGGRAYRRPLTKEDVAEHLALYEAARRDGLSHKDGIRLLLTAMLESPLFLYHWEEGEPVSTAQGQALKLGPYALAARLSYFLWASMPDASLFAAAADGRLETADEVESEARRMLADPKARGMVADFVGQWLRLHRLHGTVKDKKAYADWSPALAAAMATETETFAAEVVLAGEGTLEALLTAPYSYVNGPLAKVYGLDAFDGPARKVAFDPRERAGLLTQASFLSINANAYEPSPILRGKFVREQLLCQTVAPPPPGVPPLDPPKETTTLRARLEDHVLSGTCSRCHSFLDPIGFGLEGYDAIGRRRTEENGQRLDLSGLVKNIDGTDRAFDGPRALATLLARSPEVMRCLTKQLFRYAFGRQESREDEPSLDAAYDVFRRSGDDLRALLVAITRSPSFRYRRPEAGEAL